MKKRTLCWLIAAAVMIVAGGGLFAAAMSCADWDFTQLNTVEFDSSVYTFSNAAEISDIVIDASTADITFVLTDGESCRVECYEPAEEKHTVSLAEGVLSIIAGEQVNVIGIMTETQRVTVYLPQKEYRTLAIDCTTGDVDIPEGFGFESISISVTTGDISCCASASGDVRLGTTTGDITLERACAGALSLSVSTGKMTLSDVSCSGDIRAEVTTGAVTLENVSCADLISNGSTGRITMRQVIAAGAFDIERTTGNIRFEGCDAADIYVSTSTGSVSGSLLSAKAFITETSTGDVSVPQSVGEGRCEITTTTGDIDITLAG